MILRKGDIDNLTGNVIVYWDVLGENMIAPGFGIFAINFTVSSLPLNNKLLTATFPPIPFKDLDELIDKLSHIQCDIIYGGELKFPTSQKGFSQFYKNELDKYNKIIEEYAEIYKEKFNSSLDTLSERDKLYLLRKMSKKIRIEMDRGFKNEKLYAKKKIIRLIKNLENNDKYDVSKFRNVLFKPGEIGDKLVSLYINKFIAIYNENYEDAIQLKNKISNLENDIEKNQIPF